MAKDAMATWEPPEYIFLQLGEDFDPSLSLSIQDVTWCIDKIFDTDVKYELAKTNKEKPYGIRGRKSNPKEKRCLSRLISSF